MRATPAATAAAKGKKPRGSAVTTCYNRGMDLTTAVALHRGGRLAETEAAYRRIVAADASNGHATHLLGIVLGQLGRMDESLELLQKASRLLPESLIGDPNLKQLTLTIHFTILAVLNRNILGGFAWRHIETRWRPGPGQLNAEGSGFESGFRMWNKIDPNQGALTLLPAQKAAILGEYPGQTTI